MARAGPALLVLASRTPSKLDAVAKGCREVVVPAKVREKQATRQRPWIVHEAAFLTNFV